MQGAKKQILIVHGWGSEAKKWEGVKEILERAGFVVSIPDLPGFGHNPPPKEIWGTKDYALWLKKFVEENLPSGEFVLVGHSFGGAISAYLATFLPERIEKIILCSPAILRTKTVFKKQLKTIIRNLKKVFPLEAPNRTKKLIAKFLKNSDYYRAEGIMKEIFKKVVEEKSFDQFSSIKKPILLIWGEKDKLVPLKEGLYLKEKLANSKLVTYKDIGHSPHIKCPKRLAKEIIDFAR